MCKETFYVYKGVLYADKPEFTRVCKKQTDGNVEYAYLKRVGCLPYIIVLMAMAGVLIFAEGLPTIEHKILYNSVLHYWDGKLQINMINPPENMCTIGIDVYSGDIPLIEEITLAPGEDVGNVELIYDFVRSGDMCTLKYTIDAGWRSVTREYSVLVVDGSNLH